MIKYQLNCKNCNNIFDSWFASSKEYEKLKKMNLINCDSCHSLNIEKSIMSPRVINSQINVNNYENLSNSKEFEKIKKDLLKVRKFVEKNFQFVGDKFTQEIRNIYYNKKENKNIYGTTTLKEREELKEEGIELTSIPWIDKEN